MGTKANPGDYDCYAKAADDEPIFTLRAKDPIAPMLVRAWVRLRTGNRLNAIGEILRADSVLNELGMQGDLTNYEDKALEAIECSVQMEEWRRNKNDSKEQ